MSLINEALKKAQKLRDAESAVQGPARPAASPPATPPPPSPPKAPPAAPAPGPEPDYGRVRRSRRRQVPVTPVAIAALVAVTLGGWMLLSGDDGGDVSPPPSSPVVSAPAPVSATATEPAITATPPPARQTPAPSEVTVSLPPPTAPEIPTNRPAIAVTETSGNEAAATPVSPPVVAPVQTTPSPAVVLPERSPQSSRAMATLPANEPDPRVVAFIDRARVTGIRASPSDPKVLMNDRVYRLTDVVDRDLQLRLVAIAPRQLQFEDARGHVYTKSF